MFYVSTLLAAKGALSSVWIAAFNSKKVDGKMAEKVDVSKMAEQIRSPAQPLALRFSAQLLLGLVRIYHQKTILLQQKCNTAMLNLQNGRTPNKKNAKPIDLPPADEKAGHNTTLALSDQTGELPLPMDHSDLLAELLVDGLNPSTGGLRLAEEVVNNKTPNKRKAAAEAEQKRLSEAAQKLEHEMKRAEDLAKPSATAAAAAGGGGGAALPDMVDDFPQPDLVPMDPEELPVPGTDSQGGTASVGIPRDDGGDVAMVDPGVERGPEEPSNVSGGAMDINDSRLKEPEPNAPRPSLGPGAAFDPNLLPDGPAAAGGDEKNLSKLKAPAAWDVLPEPEAAAPEPEKKKKNKRAAADDESQATTTEEDKKQDERKKKKAKVQPVIFDARIELDDSQVRDYEKNITDITNTDRDSLLDVRRKKLGAVSAEGLSASIVAANGGVAPPASMTSSWLYPTLFMTNLGETYGAGNTSGSRVAINPLVLDMYARALTTKLAVDDDEEDWDKREAREREADEKAAASGSGDGAGGAPGGGGADETQFDGNSLLPDLAEPIPEPPAPAAMDEMEAVAPAPATPPVPGTPVRPVLDAPALVLDPRVGDADNKDDEMSVLGRPSVPAAAAAPAPADTSSAAALDDSRSKAAEASANRTAKAWATINKAFGLLHKKEPAVPATDLKVSLFSLLKPVGGVSADRKAAVTLFYQVLELSDTPKRMLDVSQAKPYADIIIKQGENFANTDLLKPVGGGSGRAAAAAAPVVAAVASAPSAGSEASDEPVAATSLKTNGKGRGRKKQH